MNPQSGSVYSFTVSYGIVYVDSADGKLGSVMVNANVDKALIMDQVILELTRKDGDSKVGY